MTALFIGVYADPNTISLINRNSKNSGSVSIAAIKYTHLIGEGIENEFGHNSTKLFLVPLGMYPICKFLIWFPRKINDSYYIPFINIIFFKQISISVYLFFFSFFWYFKNYRINQKYIFFSCVYLPFLIGLFPLKIFKSVYVTTFVPDLPEYEFFYSKSLFSLKFFFVPLYIYLSKKIISLSDYYVFITKYMVDFFPTKPYSIIEGFVDIKNNNIEVEVYKRNAIMYSGALLDKYGITYLLKAFIQIKGDYELWLFGNGDMDDIINKFSNLDSRIKYFGVRPNSEVLVFQKKAKLLINPRPSNNDFTKYSFPSKLMEYLVSGTPVLTTRLPGIPDDYSDKMYFIDCETVDGIKESILKCFSKSQTELNLFGFNAKLYVINNKNNYTLINNLVCEISINNKNRTF